MKPKFLIKNFTLLLINNIQTSFLFFRKLMRDIDETLKNVLVLLSFFIEKPLIKLFSFLKIRIGTEKLRLILRDFFLYLMLTIFNNKKKKV